MRERDEESSSYGAEALPGGLAEFNDAMRARTKSTGPADVRAAKAPLLGLIALAGHWMRKKTERR